MAAERSWKVPRTLPNQLAEKREDEVDYHPKVVSIGPFFYGEEHLDLAQDFKSVAVDLFVSGGHGSKEFYFEKIFELEGLRDLYDDNYVRDKDFFTKMMLDDAALIIIYMEIVTQMEMEPLAVMTLAAKFDKMKEHLGMIAVGIIHRDLFLLQNQIPLEVINVLVYHRYGPGKLEGLLDRFLKMIFQGEDCTKKELEKFREDSMKKDWEDSMKKELEMYRVDKEDTRSSPLHLLEASHRVAVSNFDRLDHSNVKSPQITLLKPFHSFRTATDLKAKGIHFRRIPDQSSKHVNFKSYYFFATIELPLWAVNVHTKVLLKNMVAYELSPGSSAEGEVLSYINFMKSLVDGPQDVKVLRESSILSNLLGNDEAAAKMLNEINTFGLDNAKFFGRVEREIHVHCNRMVNVWIAELLHSYFRSPWTITAFSAAITVLVISAAQLYYAVHPPAN